MAQPPAAAAAAVASAAAAPRPGISAAVGGVVRLAQLDDYITPGPACIKPILQPPPAQAAGKVWLCARGDYGLAYRLMLLLFVRQTAKIAIEPDGGYVHVAEVTI